MDCRLFSFVCCLVVNCFVGVCAQWMIDDDGCRTPARGVGSCIPVQECGPILFILEDTPKPISPELVEFLRGHQCGTQGGSFKVCCPTKPITNRLVTYEPPDVSDHENLRLLPADICGVFPEDDRIVHGNATGVFEFPWMALLSYNTNNGREFACGGTIINERYILTAAHCITNLQDKTLIGVRVGEHNINTEEDCEINREGDRVCAPPYQDVLVRRSIPHKLYNPSTYSFDIGLIRLRRKLDLSGASVKPICLPTTRNLLNYNFNKRKGLVTGWGVTETGQTSPDLRKVDLPIATQQECSTAYRQAPISHRHLCAGGKESKDSCSGDSGGPLQVIDRFNGELRFVQMGVVSFGLKICGIENYPGVYSKLAYYMNWILDNLEP